jgi:hypothetical protein
METLALKTFLLVGGMLIVTAVATRLNKRYETKWEFWGLFLGILALIFIIPAVSLTLSLALTFLLALLMGLMIGPGIRSLMLEFVIRKRLKEQGYDKARIKSLPPEEHESLAREIETEFEHGSHANLAADWNRVLSLAIFSTAGITAATAFVVFYLGYDFSFLGMILFVALLGLIVTSLLNIFFFRSPLMRLISSYIGAVIFSAYLLYDFSRLRARARDASWETAIDMAVSIYLDIINLFMDLLDIISSSS